MWLFARQHIRIDKCGWTDEKTLYFFAKKEESVYLCGDKGF